MKKVTSYLVLNSYVIAERINSQVNASVTWRSDSEHFRSILSIAKSKLGKPYDYTGILGLGINRDWQENDMWFCSEDVADTLKRSGLILSGLENVHHIFPQTCFNWEHSLLDRSVF